MEAWAGEKGQALQGGEAQSLKNTRQCTKLYIQLPQALRPIVCVLETGFHHASQDGLELTVILLLQAER